MNSPTLLHIRQVNLKAFCSECRQLQGQLNVATHALREIAGRQSESFAMLHDLDTVHDQRNQIMRVFIEHLKTHKRLVATSTGL